MAGTRPTRQRESSTSSSKIGSPSSSLCRREVTDWPASRVLYGGDVVQGLTLEEEAVQLPSSQSTSGLSEDTRRGCLDLMQNVCLLAHLVGPLASL